MRRKKKKTSLSLRAFLRSMNYLQSAPPPFLRSSVAMETGTSAVRYPFDFP